MVEAGFGKGGRALVVSPHPDDMEIGMGGTIIRLRAEGWEVVEVVATDGGGSTTLKGLTRSQLIERRRAESLEGARLLGVERVLFTGLPDLKKQENTESYKEYLISLFKEFAPHDIYVTHPELDKHPTHRLAARLTLEALDRVLDHDAAPTVWCYEVWSPFPSYDRIVDISAAVPAKRRAIEAHATQIEYRDYADGILGLNRYRALFDETHGPAPFDYAEVFIRMRP